MDGSGYGKRHHLFAICVSTMEIQKSQLTSRIAEGFSRDEASAQLELLEKIYSTAAGAALANRMTKEATSKLVGLYHDIQDIVEWNIKRA